MISSEGGQWGRDQIYPDISIIIYPDIFYIYYIIIVTINPLL